MRIQFVLAFAMMILVGCQQTPTKVYETLPTQTKNLGTEEIPITDKTVIVDARPAFEYTVSHLNGSIPLRPDEFTQREEKYRGLLDMDHFMLTRRLARYGIAPDTQVVVVGRGLKGQGEEGRMAWTLKRLGVQNVKFASIDYFSIPLSTADAPPRANVPIWKPVEDNSLEVSRDEFLKASMKPHGPGTNLVIIDVRPSEEYLGKVSSHKIKSPPDLGAVNIPWTEFIHQSGLPNETVKSKLQAIGVTPDKTIYVVTHQGVESAEVTMVLRELGYSKAANFAGGYVELMTGRWK